MPLPINISVEVIFKDKDKNKSKFLMLLSATGGHSQENPNTLNRPVGIGTQPLNGVNTPYESYTLEVFLCSYVLLLILIKHNNPHSLSNI